MTIRCRHQFARALVPVVDVERLFAEWGVAWMHRMIGRYG
jgi:hypothetical protein